MIYKQILKCYDDRLNVVKVSGFCSQHLDRLIIKYHRIVGEERLLTSIDQRIRDVAFMNNMLYAITDDGDIYRISKK